MSQVVGSSNSYKHITNTAWVRALLCILQKGCTRLAAASDTVYQLLAHGRWFSPGTPASLTTKTGRHDIVEILLKVALKHQNQIIKINLPEKKNIIMLFVITMICLLHFDKYFYSIMIIFLCYKIFIKQDEFNLTFYEYVFICILESNSNTIIFFQAR